MTANTMTKQEFEDYLNDNAEDLLPNHDHPENGGRVPWSMVTRYGTWLRRNDRIAFNVAYNEQTMR